METRRVAGEGACGGMEENTMAILDNSGFNRSKFSHHLKDDGLAFLEAVRTASLLSDNGSAPTRKMFEAVFHTLKDADSLDLIMESYQLLIELHKHFPRVLLSKEQSESSSPSRSTNIFKFIVVQEAWLPFSFGLDPFNERNEANKPSRGSVDSLGFHSLIQEVAKVDKERKSEVLELMFLKNMLLLQYLIIFLEGDFLPRNCAFKEELNWTFLRESLVNMLLGSRKILYKSLIKDCLSLMHVLSQEAMFEDFNYHKSSSMESSQEINTAVTLALPEVKKSTCAALKKFFLMVMELDSSRSSADMQGLTTRADGVRTPVVEIILDELIYDNDIRCSFLQVFDEPKWKLKIIIQYFQKYIPKSSVQTRRSSNVPVSDETFDGILKYLANGNNTRSIIKKICTEVVQLLLAHGFQAYLALQLQCASDSSVVSPEDIKSISPVEICNGLVSDFMCLKREDQ